MQVSYIILKVYNLNITTENAVQMLVLKQLHDGWAIIFYLGACESDSLMRKIL
jgi:hypothetical protein